MKKVTKFVKRVQEEVGAALKRNIRRNKMTSRQEEKRSRSMEGEG